MEGVIDSPADIVNSVEPGFFDDVTPSSDPVIETQPETPDTPTEEVIDTPGEIEDQPPVEEPAAEELPEAAAPDPNAAPAEELPEGVVKGVDKNGKPGLFLKPERYEVFHGAHKTLQQVSEVLGEPATLEALQLRERAFQAQEMLFNDVNSGDPKAQGAVINYFLNQMKDARERGEVGVDPTVPFAQTFYDQLKSTDQQGRPLYPDAHAHLRLASARDLVAELFDTAAKSGDDDLRLSVQHVVRALTTAPKGTDAAGVRAIAERMGLPFYTKAEMQNLARGADPAQLLRQENENLKAQLNGRSTTNQTAQFNQWVGQTNQAVDQGIAEEAVQPALTAVADAWKQFPNEYKTHVVDALHSKVADVVMADPKLKQRIAALQNRAKMATSAQVRTDIAAEIRQAYVNRAKLATEAQLRPVLDSANKILTGLSNANHARRSSAQGRTAPTRGAQGSVNRGISPPAASPFKNGVFDPAAAYRDGASVL